MLEAENLVVVRSGGRRTLDAVSLALAPGEIVAVEGPSGGGKSTLLWALARLLPPTSGTLRLGGCPASGMPHGEWRRRVTLVIQKAVLTPGTVADALRMPWNLGVRARAEAAPDDDLLRRELDGLSLKDVELTRPVGELSVGQTARVSFLRSLLTRPEFLLLDEPGAALDVDAAEELVARASVAAADGVGVLLVRHHRTTTPVSRTLRLADGRLTEVAS
jgi:UDP-glucose/iron transport system ATP-binding protein